MKKVVLASDTTRLPKSVYDHVWRRLEEISGTKNVEFFQVPPFADTVDPEFFRSSSAVILRPTDKFKISAQHLSKMHEGAKVYTVSKGREHIEKLLLDNELTGKDIQLFDSYPYDNSQGVARYNVAMAQAILMNLPKNVRKTLTGDFQAVGPQYDLTDKTWLMYGSGNQATHLIALLLLSGVKHIYIFNPRLNIEKFRNCLSVAAQKVGNRLKISAGSASGGLQWSAEYSIVHAIGGDVVRKVQISGISQKKELVDAGSEVDVVSLHIPANEQTFGIVDANFLSSFTRKPILINSARGELLVEEDIAKLLKEGHLSGLVVDVLNKEIEDARKTDSSRLSAFWSEDIQKFNVLITPHISGSVESDLFGMWNSVIDKLDSQFQNE